MSHKVGEGGIKFCSDQILEVVATLNFFEQQYIAQQKILITK